MDTMLAACPGARLADSSCAAAAAVVCRPWTAWECEKIVMALIFAVSYGLTAMHWIRRTHFRVEIIVECSFGSPFSMVLLWQWNRNASEAMWLIRFLAFLFNFTVMKIKMRQVGLLMTVVFSKYSQTNNRFKFILGRITIYKFYFFFLARLAAEEM